MAFGKTALIVTGVALPFDFGAAAQPVSGLYVGAGANWLVGAKGDVVGEDPANLVARAFGAPNPAAVQNAAAAAQAAATNLLLAPAARAAAQQAAAAAQAAA